MDARMPNEFFEMAVVHLPQQRLPGPKGGRKPIDHYTVLRVIWFVLVTGNRWRCSLGIGMLRRDGSHSVAGMGAGGDLVCNSPHVLVGASEKLDTSTGIIDSTHVRAFGGGDDTGPSPVDRRKKGTKYTLLVDRHGVPLVVQFASANTSDHRQILSTVAAFPEIGGKPGRPKTRPDRLYADAGYDSEVTRSILRFLGIEPFIRKQSSPHGSHLGTIRWVVERTISWIKGLRRIRYRYDRKRVVIEA